MWGWSDDCGFTSSPKGLHVMVMWWRAVCCLIVAVPEVGAWVLHVTECPSKNTPLRFYVRPTAAVIGQQTREHDRKCMLLYVLWGAAVLLHLHTFVWEINSVATRPALQQGQHRRDLLYWCAHNPTFVSIQLRNDASRFTVSVGVLATHQEEWHDQTVLTHFTGTGEGWAGVRVVVSSLFCKSLVWTGAEKSESHMCCDAVTVQAGKGTLLLLHLQSVESSFLGGYISVSRGSCWSRAAKISRLIDESIYRKIIASLFW